MKYQVWTEGFAATGENSTATFHGEVEATSFEEACIKLLAKSLDQDEHSHDGYRRSASTGRLMVWGCRCFDNEKDARASFG